MDRERWRRIEPILERALELTPEDRSAYLDEACGGDPKLRAELETLIAADARTGELLDREGDALFAAAQHDARVEIPESIGPYRILGKLGEGGMGVVYEAQQPDPERNVALKVVRAGMDSDAVLARFQAERQALGLMDHPNIATVYDAGLTETGLPYFAMELVAGEPITSFCDRQALPTEERIRLFEVVCDAIQHAHRKGIIHRDIKPSNILVSSGDGSPMPKIIDFGIAKATEPRMAEEAAFTELGQIIGTPEYMSPEQAAADSVDIDTRTDVYALGVLLYELLVGVLPYEPAELRQAGYDEMRRILRETDPPRPSTRLRSLAPQRTDDLARQRRTDPTLLVRHLEGELDWIVMRALEKDRERRYGSAAELEEDLQRFLSHEPVRARPQSRSYRIRKFVRRNRTGVAIAGTLVLAVLVAVAALAWALVDSQRQRVRTQEALGRAELARDQAEAVTSFLQILMSAPNPRNRGRDVTVREVLDDASGLVEEQLQGQPLVEARVRRSIGLTYLNLGLYDEALEHFERNRVIYEQGGASRPERLMTTWNDISLVYDKAGRLEQAARASRQAIEIAEQVHGPLADETLSYKANLASYIESLPGRADEAEALYREVATVWRDQRPVGDPNRTMILSKLGTFYAMHGRIDDAVPLLQESFEETRKQYGPEHPEVLIEQNNLAALRWMQGDFAESERLLRDLLAVSVRKRGEEHLETVTVRSNLAEACVQIGKAEEAVSLAAEAVDVGRRILKPDHWRLAHFHKSYGIALAEVGRREEALTQLRESVRIFNVNSGPEHPDTVGAQQTLDDLQSSRN